VGEFLVEMNHDDPLESMISDEWTEPRNILQFYNDNLEEYWEKYYPRKKCPYFKQLLSRTIGNKMYLELKDGIMTDDGLIKRRFTMTDIQNMYDESR
jgi:hypothetical protein